MAAVVSGGWFEQLVEHWLLEGGVARTSLAPNIQLKQGERHRLVGLDNWGIVAEIWQHTDAANPSDEEDIIRVQDDFGR